MFKPDNGFLDEEFQEDVIDTIKDVGNVFGYDHDNVMKNIDEPVNDEDSSTTREKNAFEKIDAFDKSGLAPMGNTAKTADAFMAKYTGRGSGKSIIARAKSSIMQFPCYVTQSINVAAAHTISKLFDRVYASFMQAVLSQNQIINADEANELRFMQKFHTNLKESGSPFNYYYNPVDDLDAMMQETVYCQKRISDNCILEFKAVAPDELLVRECSRLANDPLTGLYLEKSRDPSSTSNNDPGKEKQKMYRLSDSQIKALGQSFADQTADRINHSTGDKKRVGLPELLKDGDIKKINSMAPYTLSTSFLIKDANGKVTPINYIIGVKTIMHPIHANDLAEDLRELVTGKIRSLQKVRYKTGEISFLDYMFGIKGIKNDVLKNASSNRRWINTLKRLSELSSTGGTLWNKPSNFLSGNTETPVPNGTLILTQSDVSMLLDSTGIDLGNIGNAQRLAMSLFLIAIVIVDSAAGTMKVFFPDSYTDWDVQSLATIDAEVSKTDNSQLMRELNKVINR